MASREERAKLDKEMVKKHKKGDPRMTRRRLGADQYGVTTSGKRVKIKRVKSGPTGLEGRGSGGQPILDDMPTDKQLKADVKRNPRNFESSIESARRDTKNRKANESATKKAKAKVKAPKKGKMGKAGGGAAQKAHKKLKGALRAAKKKSGLSLAKKRSFLKLGQDSIGRMGKSAFKAKSLGRGAGPRIIRKAGKASTKLLGKTAGVIGTAAAAAYAYKKSPKVRKAVKQFGSDIKRGVKSLRGSSRNSTVRER